LDERARHGSPLGSRDAISVHLHSGVGPARCRRVAHKMPVLIPNCGLRVFTCASRQTVPHHVSWSELATLLVPNHVHIPRREDVAGIRAVMVSVGINNVVDLLGSQKSSLTSEMKTQHHVLLYCTYPRDLRKKTSGVQYCTIHCESTILATVSHGVNLAHNVMGALGGGQ